MSKELRKYLTKQELDELDYLSRAGSGSIWKPWPGPQTSALESEADIIGYGGAAGGGKTMLAIGLALTQHRVSAIFRQNGTELPAIIDELTKMCGRRCLDANNIWRWSRGDNESVQIELGSFPSPGDVFKYQGRPHDLIVFDEAANMRESDVRFLMAWLRSTIPGQRKRVVMTFNPPQRVTGRWIISFFAPWIDNKHPRPAKPGELRWFASVAGRDIEVEDSKPFILSGEERVYDFNPSEYKVTDIVTPMSRTFIPARVEDNPSLRDTGYIRVLQGLPEPRRSQLLYGDFSAGVEDDPFQVIPTKWIEEAQARWKKPDKLPAMDSIGGDIALGGDDNTVIARRHGMWFDVPIVYPGQTTKDGAVVAGWLIAARRDMAPIHLDLFGVGSEPYGYLMQAQQQVIGVNMGQPCAETASNGSIRFRNIRSWMWWMMREALNPINNTGIALPNDHLLFSDLTTPTWEMVGPTLVVESREDIVKRIGRSPDHGTAYCLALMATPKRADLRRIGSPSLGHVGRRREDYDPLDRVRKHDES